MRQPDIWTAGAIQNYNVTRCIHSVHTGGDLWLPARPEPHNAFSFMWRFKLAWKVLTGEYDAMRWEE
jgi:hypothetical protein